MDKRTLILGIFLGALGMYILIHGLWHLGYYTIAAVFSSLSRIRTHPDTQPKTLSSVEKMILPQVLRKFPDLDLPGLKEEIHKAINRQYGSQEDFQILSIMLNDCRKQDGKTVLIFEAPVCWQNKKPVSRLLRIRVISPEDASPCSWNVASIHEI